jgi:hypothetical protein
VEAGSVDKSGDRERLAASFDGAADLYQRARPDYPSEVYDRLIAVTGLFAGRQPARGGGCRRSQLRMTGCRAAEERDGDRLGCAAVALSVTTPTGTSVSVASSTGPTCSTWSTRSGVPAVVRAMPDRFPSAVFEADRDARPQQSERAGPHRVGVAGGVAS